MNNGKSYRKIKGFAQGIEVLKWLANQGGPVTGKKMADELRLPYDTAMCYLATAAEYGFAQKEGDQWRLGLGAAVFWKQYIGNLEQKQKQIESELKILQAEGDYGQ